MKIEQAKWTNTSRWIPGIPGILGESAQLVLAFGATQILKNQRLLEEVKKAYPGAHIFGCSTAGEISGQEVSENSLVTTAVNFEHTKIKGTQIGLSEVKGDSFQAGVHLAKSLDKDGLVHVLVLSDGLEVNGSDLVKGLMKHLPDKVAVTGGLAGDSDRFKETLVFWDGSPAQGTIAVIGLYGTRLKVGYGSLGGWDPFGPDRLITRSKENMLYELDGRSALELYKKYLGEHASGLPATGLLFPLSLRIEGDDSRLVRTILSVDEKEQSLKFAGDVPEGAYARLMKANFDRLIDGATEAAKTSLETISSAATPQLAILISCVGRKLVLKQRTEEEVEGVRDTLGKDVALTGFYSYGEICPFTHKTKSELHNQTMTVTTLLEE